MEQAVSFGNWVCWRRKVLDLTQKDLAQQVNCSVSMLRKIERDERRPSAKLAGLLADHLAIDSAHRTQFMQLARGQFVANMPAAGPDIMPPTGRPEANQRTVERTVVRNPFLISSGAMLLIIVALLLIGEIRDRIPGSAPATDELAGTSVTIEMGFDESGRDLLTQAIAPFEERTGINVEIRSIPGAFLAYINSVAEVGNPPDIVSFPQPGYLADFARQGHLVPLDSFLDEAYLQQQYTPTFLDLTTVDGRVYGAPHLAFLKGLVWYAKDDFDAAGYEVPQTWAELMALSEAIVADGRTPWCIGLESGDATGWVGTDWVEALLLRTAPPATYDAWVSGDLQFDSPEIRRVFALMAPIWLADEMVHGGREGIVKTSLSRASDPLFGDPPGCYLLKGATFTPGDFPEDAVYGEDYDFFLLPAVDAKYGEPLLGAGNMYAMFNDRPEVRELIRFLTTGESNQTFAKTGRGVSAHRDVPLEWYATSKQLRYAQLIADGDVYRFDGSDLMPGEVGFQFWQGIVDWVEEQELNKGLQEIDESWPDEEQ